MLAQYNYTLSSNVRLSVHLSIISRNAVKMAKPKITQTMLHDRPGTLVLCCKSDIC